MGQDAQVFDKVLVSLLLADQEITATDLVRVAHRYKVLTRHPPPE
jgi:hypothetical protein